MFVPYVSPRPLRGYGYGRFGNPHPNSRLGALTPQQTQEAETAISIGVTTSLVLAGAAAGSIAGPIGAAVGAVLGEIYSLTRAKKGKAEISWDSLVNSHDLFSMNGRDFQEYAWAEAFKGMTDENYNAFPGMGPNAHSDPDLLTKPMTQLIINAYVSKKVPLNASTQQVYNTIILPWLKSGAGGMVNWSVLGSEATQNQALMIMSAVDRYLAGLPIVRADMIMYSSDPGYRGDSMPTLTQALMSAGLIKKTSPGKTVVPIPKTVKPKIVAKVPVQARAAVPSSTAVTVAPTPAMDAQTAALIAQLQAQGASESQALAQAEQALSAQGVDTSQPEIQEPLQDAVSTQYAASPAFGLSTTEWILLGCVGLGAVYLLMKKK
jgi:hypothetical protein